MANVGLGLVGYIGIGQETTYGTAAAITNYFEISSESLQVQEARLKAGALARVGYLNTKIAQGAIKVSGSFEFQAPYGGWERLMKNLFGSIVSSQPDPTNNATVWSHQFTAADQLPTGLTIEAFRDSSVFVTEPNKSFQYTGCLLTGATFSCTTDDFLKAKFDIMGQQESRVAKSTPVYDTSKLAIYHQGILTYNNDNKEVGTFTINYQNALADRGKLGSRLTRQPKRSAKLLCTGSFVMEFNSWAEYDDLRNATERSMTMVFTGPVISGTYNYSITFSLNDVIISGATVMNQSPGRLLLNVNYEAYRTTTVNELVVTMQNTTTASLAG